MTKEHNGNPWLESVPPGGLCMLAGLVTLLLALGAAKLGLVTERILLLVPGLLLVGIAVMRALQNGGTVAGTRLTGGVLYRLMAVLVVTLLMMIGAIFLVGDAERHTALHALTATAPGGGLPTGEPRPFPWMVYTDAVCLFLGLMLVAAVGIGMVLRWAISGEFDADEQPVGDYQTCSALILSLAAVAALIGYLALDPAWDSLRSFLCVAALVAQFGAMLIVLPMVWRKVIASILVVLHFGGVASAITAIDPPGAQAPWLASKVWSTFYRPYLQFTYMNNAYHFYSPEPGPASLFWARLEYEGGLTRWVKIPDRQQSPVPLHYQRILAITESINQIQPLMGPALEEKEKKRRQAGDILGIPIHPHLMASYQYREPGDYSKRLIGSYVRLLARSHPVFVDDNKVAHELKRIKLYRVTHTIIGAPGLASGESPLDLGYYLPYYQGEFTPDGKLVNADDPFLYWVIPILPKANAPGQVFNFFAFHAGDQKGP